jgi:ribosomal-protein-alanine N-acetyltransferase
MAPFWPVTLKQDDLVLRPLKISDRRAWKNLREINELWFKEWEATIPNEYEVKAASFYSIVRNLKNEAQYKRALPWVIEVQGQLAGQLTVANINYGSTRSAYIGYWIGESFAGKGYTPLAVAMAIDYCLQDLSLHRIEIAIRPENTKSIRVVEKLGMRFEGLRPKFLHINGAWRDHHIFAINEDEFTDSLVSKIKSRNK